MSDMGDDFREHREYMRGVKDLRIQETLEILAAGDIHFDPYVSDGAHLVFRHGHTILDLWPGSGKWFDRKTGTRGCRLENFLAYYFAL
jgi:hypothetical protein